MSGFEEQFETYLQGHVHPDVQPQVRRLTHARLGSVSMQAFLDVAGVLKASHEAFDRELEHVAGYDAEGVYIERTQLAQQDFDAHRVDL